MSAAITQPETECWICFFPAGEDELCDKCRTEEPTKPKRRTRLTPEEKSLRAAAKKAELAKQRAEERKLALIETHGAIYELPAVVDRSGQVFPVPSAKAVKLVQLALERSDGALTVDVETSGYPVGHKHYELRSVQLGDEAWAGVFHPVTHAAEIRQLLAQATKLHAHSANADLIPLAVAGLLDIESGWDRMHDTVINAKLSDPASTGSDPGLKKLAPAVLGSTAVVDAADAGRQAVFKAGKWLTKVGLDTPLERSGWAQIITSSEAMLRYAASDVLDTAALARRLPAVTPNILERERVAQRMTARIADVGWKIDYDKVQQLTAEHTEKREEAGSRVKAFQVENPASGPQVAAALLKLGVDLPESDKGNLSVAEHVLQLLTSTEADSEIGQLAQAVLDFRHSNTVMNLFLKPYRLLCEHGDSRARPTVYTSGANTGRMTCSRPNAQQLSREGGIRSIYVADPGYVFVAADFSGVELRGAAGISQDQAMMHMIAEEDAGRFDGFHWEVARKAFGPGATKAHRYTAKRGVFGTFYGGGAEGLAKQVGVPVEQMSAIRESLRDVAPDFFRWANQLRRGAERGNTKFLSYSGRVIHFPIDTPHKAPAYAIQGSCRELLVDALVRWLDTRWGNCTLLPAHDELIVQVPAEDAVEATETLVKCMEGELYGVHIIADPGKPEEWGSTFWRDSV